MSATSTDRSLPRLSATWSALQPREQRLVLLAASVVALALLWWLALAPALATLRTAPAERQALHAQARHMRQLQHEAEQLKALPEVNRDDALNALQQSTGQRLDGAGQISMAGNRAQVTLTDAAADDLAHWLADARVNARAIPTAAHLERTDDAPVRWSGTVSLILPP